MASLNVPPVDSSNFEMMKKIIGTLPLHIFLLLQDIANLNVTFI